MNADIDKPGDRLATREGRLMAVPLVECMCPVCTRIERVIEGFGALQNISDLVGLGIVENPCSGPEDASGLGWPDLDETSCLFSEKVSVESGERTADDTKKDVTDTKGGRLYIIGSDIWIAEGRWT